MNETPLESVTKLVDDLANRLAENRQRRDDIEQLARQILEKENERLEILMKYADTEALQGIDASDQETFAGEVDVDDSSDPYREHLRLKIELQRLKEYETKACATIEKYERMLQKICWQLSNYTKDYNASKQRLIDSYKWKLQEESMLEQNLRRDNEKLYSELLLLKELLQTTSEQMNYNIRSFRQRRRERVYSG